MTYNDYDNSRVNCPFVARSLIGDKAACLAPLTCLLFALSLLLGISGCASQNWFANNSAANPAANKTQLAGQAYATQSTPSYSPTNNAAGQPLYASQQPVQGATPATNSGAYGNQPLYSTTPPTANSNLPYYAAQPSSTPIVTTARMVDPNVVPVGANEVGPPGGDPFPPVGMGGPVPSPQYGAPNPGGPAPWVGPSPGQMPAQPPVQALGPNPGQAPGTGPPIAQPVTVMPATIVEPSDEGGFDLEKLEPDYTWKEIKNVVGWGPDEAIAKAMYADGQMFYRDKKYDEAAERFYIASWRWPDSTLEEDAMFLEAESYFFADRYGKAQDAYAGLLKKHENTRYLDTTVARLFAIATFWEQLDMQYHNWPLTPNATDRTRPVFDTYGNMIAAYRSVWLSDPTGPFADVSIWRVANSHFRRKEWEDAAYHYGLIRKNHPKSKYQKDAHLLELQARMQLYQGPRYSASPLNEAEEIATQTLKQFPGQLGDEEARVRQTKAQIVELRAERDWMMAQYYDSKEYYGAAKYYYRDVLDKYPRTTIADRTRQRMTEIQDLPSEPPKHFAWLTGLFERDQ